MSIVKDNIICTYILNEDKSLGQRDANHLKQISGCRAWVRERDLKVLSEALASVTREPDQIQSSCTIALQNE